MKKLHPLSQQQVNQILEALIKKGAPKYQEVLVELTDDVATEVETQWALNPDASFSQLLEQSLSRFKKDEHRQLGNTRKLAIQRRYQKMRNEFVRPWFKLPKLMLTFSLMTLLSLVFIFLKEYSTRSVLIVFAILLVLPIFKSLEYFVKSRRFNSKQQHKLVLLSQHVHFSQFWHIGPTLFYMPIIVLEEFWGLKAVEMDIFWVSQAMIVVYLWIVTFWVAPKIFEHTMQEAKRLATST